MNSLAQRAEYILVDLIEPIIVSDTRTRAEIFRIHFGVVDSVIVCKKNSLAAVFHREFMSRSRKAFFKPAAVGIHHIYKRTRVKREIRAEICAVSAVNCGVEHIATLRGQFQIVEAVLAVRRVDNDRVHSEVSDFIVHIGETAAVRFKINSRSDHYRPHVVLQENSAFGAYGRRSGLLRVIAARRLVVLDQSAALRGFRKSGSGKHTRRHYRR